MKLKKRKKFVFLTLGIISSFQFLPLEVNANSFGAEIFCSMREGGNDHESSWDAAYSYIKKQKGGIFKVSPKQAASQITETVIRTKDKFSYCIEYLDQLHPNRALIRELEKEEKEKEKLAAERKERREKLKKELEESEEDYSEDNFDRYSY